MRPTFFVLSLFLFTSLSGTAGATEIAVLKSAGLLYSEQPVVGFKAGLPATTSIKEYNLNGQLAEGRQIAKSLRASPPDLIFPVGLKAAMAAKLEIFDQPVVFCMVLNPEAHGLPAPNMIGIAVQLPAATQLAALRAVIPNRNRVGVLYDEERNGDFIRQAHRAAEQQGLELLAVAVQRQAVGQQAAHIALARLSGQHALVGVLQTPKSSQLALNLNSAEHVGLALPPEVIGMAGHLFEGPGAPAQESGQEGHSDLIP
ncbi:MAG: ABC transporter substrate binding protein [Nitrospira sp.]|nr:ABC transporter substrate binding protein [Nitrospira sp.]